MNCGLRLAGFLALLLPALVQGGDLDQEAAPWAPPALALPGLDGRQHALADYRGSVVLVNFWGAWCPPCREEMPAMQRLKTRLRARPFRILAVNVRQEREDVQRFVKALGFDFTVLLDPWGQEAAKWKIKLYPTSFLVGPQGLVRYRAYGAIAWDEDEALHVVESLMPKAGDGSPAYQ